MPVVVVWRDPDEHAAHGRVAAQALEGMENDGTAEQLEILLWEMGLHARAGTRRGNDGPDVCLGSQRCLVTVYEDVEQLPLPSADDESEGRVPQRAASLPSALLRPKTASDFRSMFAAPRHEVSARVREGL